METERRLGIARGFGQGNSEGGLMRMGSPFEGVMRMFWNKIRMMGEHCRNAKGCQVVHFKRVHLAPCEFCLNFF